MTRENNKSVLPTVSTEKTPLKSQSWKEAKGLPNVITKQPPSSGGGVSDLAKPSPRTKERADKVFKLTLYVIASTVAAAANSITFKLMLNAYKSSDPKHPHDYEFFVNQFNVFLYVMLALAVTLQRRIKYGTHWWNKQDLPLRVLSIMGFLDAAGSVLSTMGGAYTAGAVQNLLNQVIIPMTLALSFLFLGQTFTMAQTSGAAIIFVGAAVAVFPSFSGEDAGDKNASTVLGVLVFLVSVIPGAFSNVYKEWGFSKYHVDLYYLTTCVSAVQVLFGFIFLPLLTIPAFGGLSPHYWVRNINYGFRCFLGQNSLPGDDCSDGMSSMIKYVLVNFLFNVLQLLITKHGGATLLVISAALALPVTNLAFKLHFIMGDDTEPFSWYDVAALLIVLAGFLVYSSFDDLISRKPHKRMPIQFAPGSVIYIRERSNSDPSTPGYTPLRVQPPRRRGSIDDQLGGRTPTRTTPKRSPAIPIGTAGSLAGGGGMPRRKGSLDFGVQGGPMRGPDGNVQQGGRMLTPHQEDDLETTVSI